MSEFQEWTDEQLLTRFKDPGYGDHSTEFVNRLNDELREIIRYRLIKENLDDELALRAVLETTWLRIYTGKNTFRDKGTGSARKWVHTIARRAAADLFRNDYPNVARPTISEVDEVKDSTSKETVETPLEKQEAAAQGHGVVNQLQPEKQALLVLYFFGEMTYQEIADLLGYSGPAAVYKKVMRILRDAGRSGGGEAGH